MPSDGFWNAHSYEHTTSPRPMPYARGLIGLIGSSDDSDRDLLSSCLNVRRIGRSGSSATLALNPSTPTPTHEIPLIAVTSSPSLMFVAARTSWFILTMTIRSPIGPSSSFTMIPRLSYGGVYAGVRCRGRPEHSIAYAWHRVESCSHGMTWRLEPQVTLVSFEPSTHLWESTVVRDDEQLGSTSLTTASRLRPMVERTRDGGDIGRDVGCGVWGVECGMGCEVLGLIALTTHIVALAQVFMIYNMPGRAWHEDFRGVAYR
mmetsp:Transcript_11947/g.32226  ORF Transcript_11947/g.32226 Transcript_11947/m.32226 type:complete len:261 (-) Transcript_11947:462-1244(-)